MGALELKEDYNLEVQELHIEAIHTFSPGLYIREVHLPKGSISVGKRHRHATMNMLTKGKVTINDEHTSFTVEAPFMAESAPFTKKTVYAHEDSIFINIHPTTETDLAIIEQEFTIEDNEYKELKKGSAWLG